MSKLSAYQPLSVLDLLSDNSPCGGFEIHPIETAEDLGSFTSNTRSGHMLQPTVKQNEYRPDKSLQVVDLGVVRTYSPVAPDPSTLSSKIELRSPHDTRAIPIKAKRQRERIRASFFFRYVIEAYTVHHARW